MFNFDQAILEWRRQMLAADIKSPVPLDELETHLRDEIEQQAKSGLREAEAFRTAVQQIGQAHIVQKECKIRDAIGISSFALLGLWFMVLFRIILLRHDYAIGQFTVAFIWGFITPTGA